jgi:hypothetical protein
MTPSAKAILARFSGNVTLAVDYCEQMARNYVRLRTEYRGYREEILNHG